MKHILKPNTSHLCCHTDRTDDTDSHTKDYERNFLYSSQKKEW
jgi:hypothetical protein